MIYCQNIFFFFTNQRFESYHIWLLTVYGVEKGNLFHTLIKGYTIYVSRLTPGKGCFSNHRTLNIKEFPSHQTWVNMQQYFCFKRAHFLLISHSLYSHPRIIQTSLRVLSLLLKKKVMRKSYSTHIFRTTSRKKYITFWEMEVCVFARAIYRIQ